MTVDLEKLVAVSSVNGVLKLVTTKNNGLVLEDIDTDKKRFYSSRKYNFTPLESIAIYVETEEESIPLGEVFGIMKDQVETNPTISIKSNADELKAYFEKVLPSYNKEQVYVSDIKKVIKWFDYMKERNLLNEKVETEEEVEAASEEASAE
jgi:hypothetical protein